MVHDILQGRSLDPFQRDAIAELDAGRSVLVSAPTGTGKTLIADFAIARAIDAGREVIYTAPIKALSNQKFREYTALFGDDKVGLLTGDLVIRRDAPLRIMTTEVLRNMLLTQEPMPALATVVVDEIHFLDEPERGTVWEEVLIYLPREVQVLGLSATLSNLGEFADWLANVRETEVSVIEEPTRAVPLEIVFANRTGGPHPRDRYERGYSAWQGEQKTSRRGGRGRRGHRSGYRARRDGREGGREPPTRHHEMVERLAPDLLPCLYFLTARKTCEHFALELGRRSPGFLDDDEYTRVDALVEGFAETHPGLVSPGLAALLRQGIAFHHAGLHVHLKSLVESLYEQRLVYVLYCTSTFALGINMPARAVVFHELRRFDGQGFVPLSVREFTQMAGRAGRRGIDEVGHAVVRLDFGDYREARRHIDGLLRGDAEPVRSSFNLSLNSVVNLLQRHEPDALRALLERSFLAYTLRQRRGRRRRGGDGVWPAFQRKVALLQRIEYLDDDGGFLAGARVLQHLQIEELFASELVLSGVLEALPPQRLFGALCTLATDLRRAARLGGPTGELKALARDLRRIRYSRPVRMAEQEQGFDVTFCPEMIELGVAWYDGAALLELVERLDATSDVAGLLVNGFRRAKDLAKQLREVYRAGEDELMATRLREVIRTVSRDEVEVVG